MYCTSYKLGPGVINDEQSVFKRKEFQREGINEFEVEFTV